MTDTDFEIDQALDAHLRRTLREVAATVTDREVGDNVVRLVTTAAPSGRHGRWARLGAAAAAGVVAGAGLMAVADRDPDEVAVPSATTVAVAVGPDPSLGDLARTCADNIAGQTAQFPVDVRDSLPSLPEADLATTLLFDTQAEQAHHQLLVIGESSFIVCQVNQRSALQADVNVYRLPVLMPQNDGVFVVDRTSMTGADSTHGPGWVRIIGRVGSDVAEIQLEWTDGAIVSGQVQHGWFVVEGPIPYGVLDSDERLRWTLTNGDRQSRRVDLLDEPVPAELCAADGTCVETELRRLYERAESAGRIEQATILADLDATDAERDAAQLRFADCFNAAETGATATPHGDGILAIGTSGIDDGAEREYMNAVHTLCAAAHSDLVEEAYALLDAQRRVADG